MKKTKMIDEATNKGATTALSHLHAAAVLDAELLKLSPQQFQAIKEAIYLTVRQVCALLQVTPAYIYHKVANGLFPQPVRFGARMTRFKLTDIEHYLESFQNN